MTAPNTVPPFRILQVTLDLSVASTGVFTTARNFYQVLTGQGHDVLSVSFDRNEYSSDARGFDIHSVEASRLAGLNRFGFSWSAAAGAHDGLVEARDAVFLHSLYGYHVNWAARRVQPHQCVFVVPHGALRSMCFTYRKYRKLLWLRNARPFFAERSTFIFSSAYERDEAMQSVTPLHSEVLSWPVSPTLLAEPVPLPQGPRVLLAAGRLHPSKRTLETIRAFSRLARPGWQLHLAGLPSPEVSLADVRRAAGPAWQRSIHYRGNLQAQELADAYRTASGLVLFSHGENFANSVAEALVNGCPAFVTDRVGLADEVKNHGWGRVFEHAKVSTTGEELEAVMDDCERDTCEARLLRLAQSREAFSLAKFSQRLEEITRRGVLRSAA